MKIIPTTADHIHAVAAAVTEEGAEELRTLFHMEPEEALRLSLAGSNQAWTMFAGNATIAIFGVAPISVLERRGQFWIVGTVHICKHRFAFARTCRLFLSTLFRRYDCLENELDHRNTEVVRWAKWLGVDLIPLTEHTSYMQLWRPR